jgi:RecA-family ATPase
MTAPDTTSFDEHDRVWAAPESVRKFPPGPTPYVLPDPASIPPRPPRDPEIARIAGDAKAALDMIEDVDAGLNAVSHAWDMLERNGGDLGGEAGREISVYAIRKGLDPDNVHGAEIDGVNRALDWRAIENRRAMVPRMAPKQKPAEPEQPPPPIEWLDMSRWDDEPVPERQWSVPDRVPARQAGLFSGEGGTGKSLVEMQRDVAHVLARDWLGSLPAPGPAFYIGCEDDADEIHIRLAAIAVHYGVTFADLIRGGLRVLPMIGKDATLCAAKPKSGTVETTALYKQLLEAAADIRPRNISIDTLSHAFAGNEISRVEVYGFMRHMQAMAAASGGSVTVLSHPSLAGIQSGSGLSGSTAWHGAPRFRIYLTAATAEQGETPDPDLREIKWLKNQYGSRGETMVLRYQRGLFLPAAGASTLTRIAQDSQADTAFLECLTELAAGGRRVSATKTAPTYAPAAFASTTKGKPIGKQRLKEAMDRLFDRKVIYVGPNPDVKPSKATRVILRAEAAQ